MDLLSKSCLLLFTVFLLASGSFDDAEGEDRQPGNSIPHDLPPDVPSGGDFQCPATFGLFPDPESCGHFYQCSHRKAYRMTCPAELHFNPKLQVCDWTYRAGCVIRPTARPNDEACLDVPEQYLTAEDTCRIQLIQDRKPCHELVEVQPFYERCVPEWCDCRLRGNCFHMCGSVTDYDDECARTEGLGRFTIPCRDPPTHKPTMEECHGPSEWRTWAEEYCSFLKGEVYNSCRKLVDVTPYYDRCVLESCTCEMNATCDSNCDIIDGYAQKCFDVDAWPGYSLLMDKCKRKRDMLGLGSTVVQFDDVFPGGDAVPAYGPRTGTAGNDVL